MKNDKFPMSEAPHDEPIIGIYSDGSECEIEWAEERRCMLAGNAGGHGYFGEGWQDTYNRLIVDAPEFWRPT